ncbi:MAG: hypothetical protein EXR98_09980 [Gemmataceae bacterium]|nr:hypothetical protein [Gemmataceae bacterium]
MLRTNVAMTMTVGLLVLCGLSHGQESKKPFTVIGEVKAQKETKDRKNTLIDVLAPGEEKARSYHVMYDPKIKGPVASVLAAVRAAKVGERVEMECVQTNHGPAITTFRVLKKGGDTKDKK